MIAGPNARVLPGRHEVPLELRIVDQETADALGIGGDGLVLVRPDGLPIARWAASADGSTLAAVSEAVGGTSRQGVARAA